MCHICSHIDIYYIDLWWVHTCQSISIHACIHTHILAWRRSLARAATLNPKSSVYALRWNIGFRTKPIQYTPTVPFLFQLPPPHFHWGHPNTSPNCCTKFSSNTGMLEACQGYQHIGPCPASPCTSSPKDLLEVLAVLPSTWPLQSPK